MVTEDFKPKTIKHKVIFLYDLFLEVEAFKTKYKFLPKKFAAKYDKLKEIFVFEENVYKQIEEELKFDELFFPSM